MPMDLGTSPKDNSSKGNHEEVTAMKKPPVAAAVDVALSQRSPLTLVQTQEDHSMSNKPEAQPDGSESQLPETIDPISQNEGTAEAAAQVSRATFDIPANKGLGRVSEDEANEKAWEGVAKIIENAQPNPMLLSDAYRARSALYSWAEGITGAYARALNQFPDDVYMADKVEDILEAGRKLNELFSMHAVYSARNADSFKFYTHRFPGVYLAEQRRDDSGPATCDVALLLGEIAQNSLDGTADGDRIHDLCNNWIERYREECLLFPTWVAGTYDDSKHYVMLPTFEAIASFTENRSKRVDGVAPVME